MAKEKLEKKLLDYNVGDLSITNNKIDILLGKNFSFLTYLTLKENGKYKIGYMYDNDYKIYKLEKKLSYFNNLSNKIEHAYFDKELETNLFRQLGITIFSAVKDKKEKKIGNLFKNLNNIVNQSISEHEEKNHIKFIAYNILHTFLAISILFIFYKFILEDALIKNSLLVGIGGIIGSMISIVQRKKHIKKVHIKFIETIVLSSIISIILGFISGFFIYWASIGNLIFGSFKDSIATLFILAILTGASERYFNSLLKNTMKKQTNNKIS